MAIADSSKLLLIRMTLFSIYVLLGAVVFQAIESEPQMKEIDRVRATRREILNRYNITAEDAEKWMKTLASTSMGNEDFLHWNYGNSFLFAMVVVTTIGKIFIVSNFTELNLKAKIITHFTKLCLKRKVKCSCMTSAIVAVKKDIFYLFRIRIKFSLICS